MFPVLDFLIDFISDQLIADQFIAEIQSGLNTDIIPMISNYGILLSVQREPRCLRHPNFNSSTLSKIQNISWFVRFADSID